MIIRTLAAAVILASPGLAQAACTYEIIPAKTELKWTGYKTPKKVGVSGKFTAIDITNVKKGASLEEAMAGLKFSIGVDSTSSGDKVRDVRISKILLAGTEKITGQLDSSEKEVLTFSTTVNKQTKPIQLKYSKKGNQVHAQGYMDILDFALSKNLATFAAACQEKHEG